MMQEFNTKKKKYTGATGVTLIIVFNKKLNNTTF